MTRRMLANSVAGHQVTALYEIIPVGAEVNWAGSVDPLKYQTPKVSKDLMSNGELCTVKLRYKRPDGVKSIYQDLVVLSQMKSNLSPNGIWASQIAAWGMKMKNSEYLAEMSYDKIKSSLSKHIGDDPYDHRRELISLVETAWVIAPDSSWSRDKVKLARNYTEINACGWSS